MKVLHNSFSYRSKSVSSTIEFEGLKHNLFYVSTGKGKSYVSKLDSFSIDRGFVVHTFDDIIANMNILPSIKNDIKRATEKALLAEHQKCLEHYKELIIQKYSE